MCQSQCLHDLKGSKTSLRGCGRMCPCQLPQALQESETHDTRLARHPATLQTVRFWGERPVFVGIALEMMSFDSILRDPVPCCSNRECCFRRVRDAGEWWRDEERFNRGDEGFSCRLVRILTRTHTRTNSRPLQIVHLIIQICKPDALKHIHAHACKGTAPGPQEANVSGREQFLDAQNLSGFYPPIQFRGWKP